MPQQAQLLLILTVRYLVRSARRGAHRAVVTCMCQQHVLSASETYLSSLIEHKNSHLFCSFTRVTSDLAYIIMGWGAPSRGRL